MQREILNPRKKSPRNDVSSYGKEKMAVWVNNGVNTKAAKYDLLKICKALKQRGRSEFIEGSVAQNKSFSVWTR